MTKVGIVLFLVGTRYYKYCCSMCVRVCVVYIVLQCFSKLFPSRHITKLLKNRGTRLMFSYFVKIQVSKAAALPLGNTGILEYGELAHTSRPCVVSVDGMGRTWLSSCTAPSGSLGLTRGGTVHRYTMAFSPVTYSVTDTEN